MDAKLNSFNQMLLSTSTLAIWPLLINLVIGFLLGLVVRWHFRRFGCTLTNREELGLVFPMIILTIILIISVVKSSLALALGLVGALSIVRFRTPVKEPEELTYIFLCIAVGLALGAGQTIACIIATAVILILAGMMKWFRTSRSESGLFLSLQWTIGSEDDDSDWLARINKALMVHARACDLRRFDDRRGACEAMYYINLGDSDSLSALTQSLRECFPDMAISFLDQKNVSGF